MAAVKPLTKFVSCSRVQGFARVLLEVGNSPRESAKAKPPGTDYYSRLILFARRVRLSILYLACPVEELPKS